MLKKIDIYILKRYLATFTIMLLLFIPIGIVIDVSEKVNKMIDKNAPLDAILLYYVDFTVYFANLLFPIFLFLSVIWFTSRLANNSEIIAILSSGISFQRFLRPYFIGATAVSIFALIMGFFLVPKASKGFNDFQYTYLKNNAKTRETSNIFRQISDNEYIYVNNYNFKSKTGFNFVYEKFEDNILKERIAANRIKYNTKTKKYTLYSCKKRIIGTLNDSLIVQPQFTRAFSFEPDDLTPVVYVAETMTIGQLYSFIEKEEKKGNGNISSYLVVLYKKFSLPVSTFILTIIAVAVSSMKRRGGMGVNLAIGIAVAFSFVFFDKVFGTMAEKSTIPPLLAVWFPNIVFGLLAFYLLRNAKR